MQNSENDVYDIENETDEEIRTYEDYIDILYMDLKSEYRSEMSKKEHYYESFEEYMEMKIKNLESWEKDSFHLYRDVLELHKKITAKEQEVQTNKSVVDAVSLDDMSIDELTELATKNQAKINENEKVIKDVLIKRILEQQEEIRKQEEEIKRLSGQKVM